MKRIKGLLLLMIITILLSGCQKEKNETATNASDGIADVTSSVSDTTNNTSLQKINYFDSQSATDHALLEESKKGYSFEKPQVIVNPYENSPLTAVVVFHTDNKIGGTITVEGKASEDNITGSFLEATDHIVPIYGLYAGAATKVKLTLEDGRSTTFEVRTDAVDFNTDGFRVDMKEASAYDFTKLTFVCDFDGNLTALDSKGDLRWFFNNGGFLGVKPLTNGHLAVPAAYTLKAPYYKSGILEMDLLGKVYHEYAIPGGEHHDIVELPNKNLLVATNNPDSDTVEDYIVELDRNTGEIVWKLDLKDLIDPSEGGSINRTDEDWFHNNGLWYDEASDTLLVSGRHVDAILGIDKTNKKLKWILGDSEGWSEKYQKYFFAPAGDKFEWQYAQHQVSMLSNGDIMCFDNGAGRTKVTKEDQKVTGDAVYSRAVVYRIDEKNMTIRQIWEYGKELGEKFNSEWVSGAISLDNDPENIWITSGANLYNKAEDNYDYGPSDMFNDDLIRSTNVVQVKDDKPVYTMKLDLLSYRSLRLSPYGDAGVFDINTGGSYLGSLGVTVPTDTLIDITDAKKSDDQCSFSLDPIKLTLSANYSIPTEEDLKDSYLVLQSNDDTELVYLMQQATSEDEKKVNVSVTGYLSPEGLKGKTYDIYVNLGGMVYNTGRKVTF